MKDPDGAREIHFNWRRYRLFDRLATLALYRSTLGAVKAVVQSTEGRTQRKYRPIPLATVEVS